MTRSSIAHRDARERAQMGLIGLSATALLHTLLVAPLMLSGRQIRVPTNEQGAQTSGLPVMTVVDLEKDTEADEPASNRAKDAVVSPRRFLIPVGGVELRMRSAAFPTLGDAGAASGANDEPDSSARALMFGRYLEQVTARVERAWVRPRSPIGAAAFTCLVQVIQDRERNVKEVALEQCNGTSRWQLSLVHAIESASPFPAPPDAAVFSQTLTIRMTAEPFVEGGPVDGYERAPHDVAAVGQVPISGRR